MDLARCPVLILIFQFVSIWRGKASWRLSLVSFLTFDYVLDIQPVQKYKKTIILFT